MEKQVMLKREIGLFSASSLIISTMIGSGIFISPTAILQYSGSFGLCLIMWAVTGFASLLGGWAFAELGNVIPRSGGQYAFFTDSFGPLHKYWGAIPAFVYAFTEVLISQPCGIAIVALTSAEYLVESLLNVICIEGDTIWLKRLIAIMEISIITYINMASVKLYLRIQNVCTVLKLLACLVVIGGGVYEVSIGNYENLTDNIFKGTTVSAGNIVLAFYNGMWAYGGWSNITTITEELKKPDVNILRSLLISIPFVTTFYLLMNMSYMTAMTTDEMLSSQAVAITFGSKMLGNFLFVIPLGVTISTFGCAMAVQFSNTRLCYVAAQYNHMPKLLSFIHLEKLTPGPAVLLQGILAILMTMMGDIIELIQFSGFLFWMGIGLCMVSLFIFRKTKPNAYRPIKVPIPVAVFVLLISAFLSVTTLLTDLSMKYFIAIGAILLAVAVYSYFVYKSHQLKCMGGLTVLTQKLFTALYVSEEENEVQLCKADDVLKSS